MRSVLISLAALVAGTTAANAALTVGSTDYGLAAPAGASAVVDFDDPSYAGFTLGGAGYNLVTGTTGDSSAPAGGPLNTDRDTTKYLSVYNGAATLRGSDGYKNVSLFWGSIDDYNALDLLDADGNVFDTVTYSTIGAGSNGDQLASNTNRRVDIASTQAIYGLQFRSTAAAFEVDNIAFSGAVPEPASWALMLGGFGMIGGALRSRRKAAVTFA
jgi:hypothetical protein